MTDPLRIICITTGGPIHRISMPGINYSYSFEMHPAMGLLECRENGDGTTKKFPRKIYEAISLWQEQGQRVDEHGRCVWEALEDD